MCLLLTLFNINKISKRATSHMFTLPFEVPMSLEQKRGFICMSWAREKARIRIKDKKKMFFFK